MESEEDFFGFDNDVIESEGCKVVTSNRGGFKLIYDGHVYYKDSTVSFN